LRPLLKDWRFYQLVSRAILRTIAAGHTPRHRDWVNRWTEKVCRRVESVNSLLLLEQYGHVLPRPIRRQRLPSLADRLMEASEWVQTQVYYEWLLGASTLAYEEGLAVERRLREGTFTVRGQT
jgi:hypothetical protein